MNELRREIVVRCGREHAFTVFTERVDLWWPRGHRRFTDGVLVFEPKEGGRFLERAGAQEALLGEVVEWAPPERLRYRWYPGGRELADGRAPTLVEVVFLESGGETRVQVLHTEGESELGELWPERVAIFQRGWELILDAFQKHLDTER